MAKQTPEKARLDSDNVATQQIAPIDLSEYQAGDAQKSLEVVTDGISFKDAAELAAFMEEKVEIRIHPSDNPLAERYVPLGVNGEMVYLERDRRLVVKRKYVEVLCRAKRVGYTQDLSNMTDEQRLNTLHANRGLQYPFSIIRDTQKGMDWARNIMEE